MLYDECILLKVKLYGQAMMDFAKDVLHLSDADVQSMGVMRLFQDGEGGIIHQIMNTLTGRLSEIVEGKPSTGFAQSPNAQTESWQINDVAGIHPTIHEGFKSEEFSCLYNERVQMIIDENPGLIPALQYLNDSSLNSKSKLTYHNALSCLIPLVHKAVQRRRRRRRRRRLTCSGEGGGGGGGGNNNTVEAPPFFRRRPSRPAPSAAVLSFGAAPLVSPTQPKPCFLDAKAAAVVVHMAAAILLLIMRLLFSMLTLPKPFHNGELDAELLHHHAICQKKRKGLI